MATADVRRPAKPSAPQVDGNSYGQKTAGSRGTLRQMLLVKESSESQIQRKTPPKGGVDLYSF
ncbi:hypothetical protein L3V59_15985 [Burkholderia aenigmatica]|uniref:hypothetical protein n=1 Tax=Burkholderia aenigmatica TaxID=2015348 RepID=UPI001F2550B9|nr:hypothetical protein [Burkholderia aenigmatica]UKD11126.1 hypothetical protein L3V59_15985 [Burkholderia aenigmatica]